MIQINPRNPMAGSEFSTPAAPIAGREMGSFGEPYMPNYHLYFMRQGKFVSAVDIEARDDDEATRLARQKDDGDVVEVWNDDRRLRVLATAGSALPGAAAGIFSFDQQELGHGG